MAKVKLQVEPLEGFPARDYKQNIDEIINLPSPVTKTADATLDGTEQIVLADGSSNTVTLTLSSDITAGTKLILKAIDVSSAVDVDTEGSETIDGAASYTFTTAQDCIEIVFDGTDWHIVSEFTNV